MLSRSCFSVTMASSIEEYIEELKDKSENANTKHGVLKKRSQKVGK